MNAKGFSRIAVIGAGSWGTALGNLLAENGRKGRSLGKGSRSLSRDKNAGGKQNLSARCEVIPRVEPRYLFKRMPLFDKELVVLAVPSHVFREVITDLRPYLHSGICLMAATKGIENESLMLMSEVTEDVLGAESMPEFGCLSGPSFAGEVSRKLPAAVTIAGHDLGYAERLQKAF